MKANAPVLEGRRILITGPASQVGFPVARDRKARRMWLVHTYGMVGAGRDTSPDSGGGMELYAVIGQAPRHLDRNVTLLGRVLQGMELLSALPRGTGAMGFYERPDEYAVIKSCRVAADVPAAERTELEVLRTDTPLLPSPSSESSSIGFVLSAIVSSIVASGIPAA